MKRDKFDRSHIALYLCGLLLMVWFGLRLAPALSGGLPAIMEGMNTLFQYPFQIKICKDSLRAVLVSVMLYTVLIGAYLSDDRNYRRREEHGSAKWGDPNKINKHYAEPEPTENVILSEHVSIGLDSRKHQHNLNVTIVGGSGSGKSRNIVIPNLMNANTSFMVLDPKGELLRTTGNLLKEEGYEIRVLDLIRMERSHCYNPFRYIRNDADIQKLVTILFDSTTPKGSHPQEPYWDQMAGTLLKALMFLLYYEAPKNEQSFQMVLELIRAGEVREGDDTFQSPLDIVFERLEMRKPGHIAYRMYQNYRGAPGKTLKSIQSSLIAHLEKFELDSLASITQTDELDLPSMGEKKTALFAVIPDSDSSFNFLVSILYTQLFQQLEDLADFTYSGRLPVHVSFLMDEFANVALPDDFQKSLATMRSREISATIILQNLAQLKALFEKDWESIIGNCDSLVYLGGNEQSTHEYISKSLGKETIDADSYGRSRGRNGSFTTNRQVMGRDLMTPDEVRMMDYRDAIVLIRGENPIIDRKYDLHHHPNASRTTVGGAEPYIHGADTRSIATVAIDRSLAELAEKAEHPLHRYEILTPEELEEKLNIKEN